MSTESFRGEREIKKLLRAIGSGCNPKEETGTFYQHDATHTLAVSCVSVSVHNKQVQNADASQHIYIFFLLADLWVTWVHL